MPDRARAVCARIPLLLVSGFPIADSRPYREEHAKAQKLDSCSGCGILWKLLRALAEHMPASTVSASTSPSLSLTLFLWALLTSWA